MTTGWVGVPGVLLRGHGVQEPVATKGEEARRRLVQHACMRRQARVVSVVGVGGLTKESTERLRRLGDIGGNMSPSTTFPSVAATRLILLLRTANRLNLSVCTT